MIPLINKFFFWYVISLAILPVVFADPISSDRPININPLPDNVSIFRLDNGLQVLLIENNGLPMTGVNVVVKTGSAYETFSTSGMSHMLEHLLFNGTTTRTQKELYDAVDMIGGYNNANTGRYYTNFMMVTPAENIREGMQVQADMLFNSTLPEDKFEKEKGIVLEEIARSLENNDEQLTRNEEEILYRGHALSLPTLGTYTTIVSMNRQAVEDYYKNAYVPNNMIMSVIGNFQSDSMRTWIKAIYGKEAPKMVRYPANRNWAVGFEKNRQDGSAENLVYHRFYGGEDVILQLYYELPPIWHDLHFEIMDELFSRERSRIIDLLKDKYPEVDQLLRFEMLPSAIKNYLKVTYTQKSADELSSFARDLNQILRDLRFNLPSESLDQLATKAKTSFFQNIEKPHMFGIYNAAVFAERGIEAVLSSYTRQAFIKAASDIAPFNIVQDPLTIIQMPLKRKKVSEAARQSAAQKYLDPNNGLIVIAEQNANSNLLAIHFLLKYKAQFDARFGKDAAKILHDCLGERLNSLANQKISNQYGLTITVNDNPYIPMDNIYLDPDFGYIRVEGLADDIPGVISYLKDQIGGFTPTSEEYQAAVTKSKMPVMGMGSSQSSMMFEQAWEKDVYVVDKYPVNKQTGAYEDLVKMAALYFNPANMIISVVSPLSSNSVFDDFRWNLSAPDEKGFPQKQSYTRQLKINDTPIREELKGGGERSFLFWGFVKSIEINDRAALQALGLLLNDYIVFEIREKQGRAYRMKAGIELVGDKALFSINLGTRPENIDPIIEQSPGFFSKKTVNSFSEFDLKKSLNMFLGRMMFRHLSSINRAYYLGHSEYFQGDMHYDAQSLQDLKKVTLDEVKNVAGKYLSAIVPVIVIVR